MIKPLLCLMLPLGVAHHASATACAMNPAPIEVTRIAREPAIKSYVVDKKRLALAALLKNGSTFKLVHMGCAHTGATATLWFDSPLPLADPQAWFKDIVHFARTAFAPEVANDIAHSLKRGKIEATASDSGIVIDAAPSEFMSYSVSIEPAEQGVLMTISYSLG